MCTPYRAGWCYCYAIALHHARSGEGHITRADNRTSSSKSSRRLHVPFPLSNVQRMLLSLQAKVAGLPTRVAYNFSTEVPVRRSSCLCAQCMCAWLRRSHHSERVQRPVKSRESGLLQPGPIGRRSVLAWFHRCEQRASFGHRCCRYYTVAKGRLRPWLFIVTSIVFLPAAVIAPELVSALADSAALARAVPPEYRHPRHCCFSYFGGPFGPNCSRVVS